MNINTCVNDTIFTVSPEGRLDSASSGEFKTAVYQNLPASARRLVFDFEKVDFISSMGIRIIVGLYKEFSGLKIVIVNANPSVREVFRLSGLNRFFED